jgi:hypothetical protein
LNGKNKIIQPSNEWKSIIIDTVNPKLTIDMNYYVAGLNSTE